jgi:hypothetical protein
LLEDVVISFILPKEKRRAIMSHSRRETFEGGNQFNNISPPERSLVLLSREPSIRILIIPNQVYQWDICLRVEFVKKFHQQSIIMGGYTDHSKTTVTLRKTYIWPNSF